jgi:hypothetical protein
VITDILRTVPRTAVHSYLRVLRSPLTVVERIARQQDNGIWPPALAFEGFEASVETVTGSLLRDATLSENGRLRQAKVAKLREAGELKTVAKVEESQALTAEQQRQAEISAQRDRAVQQAAERKTSIKKQAAAKRSKVDAATATKKSAARAQQKAQDKVIERRDRASRGEALEAESKAIDLTASAIEADETAELIDVTLEGAKEARKTD